MQQTRDAAKETVAWITDFEAALTRREVTAASELFTAHGQWRDIIAFTWTIKSISGRPAIEALLRDALASAQPAHFCIDPRFTPPRWVDRAGTECIEAFLTFETAFGRASGVLRLIADETDSDRMHAWTLSTQLQELAGFAEHIGKRRPAGPSDL